MGGKGWGEEEGGREEKGGREDESLGQNIFL